MARPARFELTTPAFGGQYSIQLSYGRVHRSISRPAPDPLTVLGCYLRCGSANTYSALPLPGW